MLRGSSGVGVGVGVGCAAPTLMVPSPSRVRSLRAPPLVGTPAKSLLVGGGRGPSDHTRKYTEESVLQSEACVGAGGLGFRVRLRSLLGATTRRAL